MELSKGASYIVIKEYAAGPQFQAAVLKSHRVRISLSSLKLLQMTQKSKEYRSLRFCQGTLRFILVSSLTIV